MLRMHQRKHAHVVQAVFLLQVDDVEAVGLASARVCHCKVEVLSMAPCVDVRLQHQVVLVLKHLQRAIKANSCKTHNAASTTQQAHDVYHVNDVTCRRLPDHHSSCCSDLQRVWMCHLHSPPQVPAFKPALKHQGAVSGPLRHIPGRQPRCIGKPLCRSDGACCLATGRLPHGDVRRCAAAFTHC